EVRRLRNERRPPPLLDVENRKPDEDVLEGRAICNAFARSQGWPDFETAFTAGAISYADVVKSVFATAGFPRRMPGSVPDKEYDLTNLQKDLGVDAKPRNPKFNPTPEQMTAGRAALGIPEPEPKQQPDPEPQPQERTANA